MNMQKRLPFLLRSLLLAGCLALTGCQGSSASTTVDENAPLRDCAPVVLVPEASGTVTEEKGDSIVDYSHAEEGYLMVYHGGGDGKFQLEMPDSTTYTYSLPADTWQTFPLAGGDGSYNCKVFRLVKGSQYALDLSCDIEAAISHEFGPWLYPNQFVNFNETTAAVAKGEELASGTHSDLEVISNVYNYLIENISYDEAKAQSVEDGYIPDVDAILSSGAGICFDYASVMATMLRSQNIPTRLEVGYAGSAYHAWISTHIDGAGWVNGIIEFDGADWELMDPTFAASSTEKELKKFIGDGSNYQTKYLY